MWIRLENDPPGVIFKTTSEFVARVFGAVTTQSPPRQDIFLFSHFMSGVFMLFYVDHVCKTCTGSKKKCGTMTMSVLQSEFFCTCCQGSVGNRDPFPELVSERACFTISGFGFRHSDRCHCDSFQDHPNDQWHQGYKGLSTKVTRLIFCGENVRRSAKD